MMVIRGKLEDLVRKLTSENKRLKRELAESRQSEARHIGQLQQLGVPGYDRQGQ